MPVEALPARALPYCLDFVRARAIYVAGIDNAEIQAAPFYYLHLRRNARELVSVPLEHGPLFGNRDAQPPLFLFSPGRCGSTLLSRILFEAGIAGVSEADFFTQMSTPFWSNRHNPLRETFRGGMWNMAQDLVTALGAGHAPVVKLRAESCRTPELFLKGNRQRTLVMLRAFEPWARSTARTFGAGPGKAVRKYMRALTCWAFLRANSDCHVVSYEDLLSDSAKACAALAGFLGMPIDAAAVARAKANDSQEDTPMGQGTRKHRPGWEGKFDAAMQLWHSPHMVQARSRMGLQDVRF